MVNLSQPVGFQSAAMAALDAVESRALSRANSDQKKTPSDASQRNTNRENTSHGRDVDRIARRKDEEEFELDDEGMGYLLNISTAS